MVRQKGPANCQVYATVPRECLEELDKRSRAMGMTRSRYLGCLIEFSLESSSNRVGEVLGHFIFDVRGKLGLFPKRGKAPEVGELSSD
jgi:hypothetical protein